MCTLKFDDGSVLKLTDEHPVHTLEGWKSLVPEHTRLEAKMENITDLDVSKLKVGDYVDAVRFNKKTNEYENYLKSIVSISCENTTIQTYNLKKIAKVRNFYADNVLVHNVCGP